MNKFNGALPCVLFFSFINNFSFFSEYKKYRLQITTLLIFLSTEVKTVYCLFYNFSKINHSLNFVP